MPGFRLIRELQITEISERSHPELSKGSAFRVRPQKRQIPRVAVD